jgi:hydroxypyruvate reductase
MELVWAALGAVNPYQAVSRHLRLEGSDSASSPVLHIGSQSFNSTQFDRVVVVGAGKAGAGMATAVEAVMGDLVAEGWVNVRYGYESQQPLDVIHIHQCGHPNPDEAGIQGTGSILDILSRLSERDLAIMLLSGGASALLEQPAPGISLQDLQILTDLLLRSGATITQVNTVRKHISQVKGGRLAQVVARRGARATIIVVSDVVGSPLDSIGSGPFAPDPTTFADAWSILQQHDLVEHIPDSIGKHLQNGLQGQVADTPKPGDPVFERINHTIVADNRAAGEAVVDRAEALGFHSLLLTTYLEGEAREAGSFVAALAKEEARHNHPLPRPACLVLGGETTVTVRGSGLGGRNQELALAAGMALDGWEGLLVLTLATDGTDGPTDAAGAIVTGRMVRRARDLGLEPADYLERNDSYNFFSTLGDLVVTGPTGTNVNDLTIVLAF